MPTLYIDLETTIHRALKIRAAEEGRTLGAVVHDALAKYLAVGIGVPLTNARAGARRRGGAQ